MRCQYPEQYVDSGLDLYKESEIPQEKLCLRYPLNASAVVRGINSYISQTAIRGVLMGQKGLLKVVSRLYHFQINMTIIDGGGKELKPA
ncbi:unnamed protein product [Protopolystoma xenopodis]|uniref:Uncharacterized protein n=1 Tax=Protopolystoma xenopodis TaxID=117903 RepID=A0A448WBC0_9PLAT|nr:unnamed protein product [Protopolystoma xenopodis]